MYNEAELKNKLKKMQGHIPKETAISLLTGLDDEVRWLHPYIATRLLGCCGLTLRRWCAENLIDAKKTAGGHNRYNKSDLIKLVKQMGP